MNFFTRVKVKEVAAAKVKLTVDRVLYGFATLFAGSPRCGQLPDPTGPLSSSLPSSAIDEANASARQEEATKTKRGPYRSHERNTLFPPSDLELLDLLK